MDETKTPAGLPPAGANDVTLSTANATSVGENSQGTNAKVTQIEKIRAKAEAAKAKQGKSGSKRQRRGATVEDASEDESTAEAQHNTDKRITITLTGDLGIDYATTESLLRDVSHSGALLYVRSGCYVTTEDKDEEILLKDHSEPSLAVVLSSLARYMRVTKTDGAKSAYPPRELVRGLLDAPVKVAPPIKYVSRVPVIGRSGHIRLEPGYDPETQVIYAPHPSLVGADLTPDISPEGVKQAADLLLGDLLGDFPFASSPDRANALAMTLEPFARTLFQGPSPLYAIDGPDQGVGKGRLVEACAWPSQGRTIPARQLPPPNDEAEANKSILGILLAGKRFVRWDNSNKYTIAGDALESLLTASWYEGRRLGTNSDVSAQNLATWAITGVNMTFGGTMPRRVIPIRLDPQVEDPWTRTGFRHPKLLGWAEENLATLVRACLSIVLAWIQAGSPEDPAPAARLGSYESWQAVVPSIVTFAGVEGVLANVPAMWHNTDPEANEWKQLIDLWWEAHKSSEQHVREIMRIADDHHLLSRVLGDRGERSAQTRLGNALKRHRDRVIGGKTVRAGVDSHDKSQIYWLEAKEDHF